MKVDKKAKGVVQSELDGILDKPAHMKVYMRDDAMHVVAQFVACDDQVCKMLMPQVLCVEIDILRPGSCYY